MTHQNPPIQILRDKELYVFDMDGTIYLGMQVFDFAIRFIDRLRANGKLYSGTGISTDIIGASIRAYVNAINKIAYEQKI